MSVGRVRRLTATEPVIRSFLQSDHGVEWSISPICMESTSADAVALEVASGTFPFADLRAKAKVILSVLI